MAEEEKKLLRELIKVPNERLAGKIEGLRFMTNEIDFLLRKKEKDKLFKR